MLLPVRLFDKEWIPKRIIMNCLEMASPCRVNAAVHLMQADRDMLHTSPVTSRV